MPAISMFYGIIMVQAWIEIHREDLLADWELAVNGQAHFSVHPHECVGNARRSLSAIAMKKISRG